MYYSIRIVRKPLSMLLSLFFLYYHTGHIYYHTSASRCSRNFASKNRWSSLAAHNKTLEIGEVQMPITELDNYVCLVWNDFLFLLHVTDTVYYIIYIYIYKIRKSYDSGENVSRPATRAEALGPFVWVQPSMPRSWHMHAYIHHKIVRDHNLSRLECGQLTMPCICDGYIKSKYTHIHHPLDNLTILLNHNEISWSFNPLTCYFVQLDYRVAVLPTSCTSRQDVFPAR